MTPRPWILTLVGKPGALDASVAHAAADAVGGRAVAPDWLAPGRACDITVDTAGDLGDDLKSVIESARGAIDGAEADICLQPAGGRRKRLLIADMDSTVVTSETLDELASRAGLKDRIAGITARAMNGELDFAEALRERVAMLKGLPTSAIDETVEETRISDGARELVATMRTHGAYTALISGGFTEFTSKVRNELGFDLDKANRLNVADGALDGTVGEPILDRHAKLETLTDLSGKFGIPTSAAIVVGDGANDLPMIQAVEAGGGCGVAYFGKPQVVAETAVSIRHTDLRSLLYFQGYRDGEIVTEPGTGRRT